MPTANRAHIVLAFFHILPDQLQKNCSDWFDHSKSDSLKGATQEL